MKEIYSFACERAHYLFLSQQCLVTGFYYNFHPNSSLHKAEHRKFNLKGKPIASIFLDVPFP